MKMTTLKGLTAAGLALAVGSWFAWAQEDTTVQQDRSDSTTEPTTGSAAMMGGGGGWMSGHGMMGGGMMTSGGHGTMGAADTASGTSTDESVTAGHRMVRGQGMMDRGGMMQGNDHMQQTMQMWGMTPEMRQRGQMMMHATLTREDPATILGLKDQFALTDDQITKLEALLETSREDTRATLTDEQRTQLDNLPSGPGSMAQMYGRIMRHMHGTQSDESGDTTTTPCPMMQMMAGNMMGGNMMGGGQHQTHYGQ